MRTRIFRSIALVATLATMLAPSAALAAAHSTCARQHHPCASISPVEECCCHTIGAQSTTPAVLVPAVANPVADVAFLPAGHRASVPLSPRAFAAHDTVPRAPAVEWYTLFSVLLI